MSSKSLQKASIINIQSSKIRIKHPDISRNPSTTMGNGIDAGGTALTVLDNNGFDDDDYLILGRVGDSQTEAIDINGAVTRGTSLTITDTIKFSHELSTPVTKIYETQIKIYGSDTTGAGTLIETVDIEWDKEYTEYTLITTDTAYSYYYATYYDETTEGAVSDYIASTGLASNTVYKVIEQALNMTDTVIGQGIDLEMCIGWANDCQDAISQFLYQDSRTMKYNPVDWGHEIDEDTTLTISENQNRYDISSLNLKYTATRSIISCRIGDLSAMEKINPVEMDEELKNKPYTEVATQAEIGDTSLVVDSDVEFSDTGSFYLGSDIITYTDKTGTTFTGIPASGTGSITEQHLVDSPVWQNASPSIPNKFTIFDGYLIFNNPPKSTYEDYSIKLKLYKKLTALTEASDTIVIPFYNVFQYYIASRIQQRKGDSDQSLLLLEQFNKMVLSNAKFRDVVPKAKKILKVYSI